jgi:hypothetical protein
LIDSLFQTLIKILINLSTQMLIHHILSPFVICQFHLLLAIYFSCSKSVFAANKHAHAHDGTDALSANSPIFILVPLPAGNEQHHDRQDNPFGITMLQAMPVLDEVGTNY